MFLLRSRRTANSRREIARFTLPDPRKTGKTDIVAVGGSLEPEIVHKAYGKGIFPWPHKGYPLLWFCPMQRPILPFDTLHIPESLAKARRKSRFTFTIDRAFERVIEACRTIPRADQDGTWITDEIVQTYTELHYRGHVHSVEVWDENGKLVGGLYGVDGGGVYSGESMFHLESNASKLALLFLIDHLRERGLDFIDVQQMTPHMERLGAIEIPRNEFLDRWAATQARNLILFEARSSLEQPDK